MKIRVSAPAPYKNPTVIFLRCCTSSTHASGKGPWIDLACAHCPVFHLSRALLVPRFPASSGSPRLCRRTSTCFMGSRTFALDLLPTAPLPPMQKTGAPRHGTSFYTTLGHTPNARGTNIASNPSGVRHLKLHIAGHGYIAEIVL